MTAKKKLIIAFSIAGAIIVALTIALVSVLAAFTTETTSSFSVQYTAVNVNATIKATYSQPTAIVGADYDAWVGSIDATSMYFNYPIGEVTFDDDNSDNDNVVDSGETATGTLNDPIEVSITRNQIIIIKYEITNKNTEAGQNLYWKYEDNSGEKVDNDTFVAENMIVRYSLDGKSWETTLGQFNLIGNRTINPNSSSIFYVSIALADRTKNANLHEMVTKISLSIDDLLI